MEIDAGSHIPIYLQIAQGIRTAVAAGVYRPGETLPSLRALAIDVKVNPNTVQRAYDALEREGLVYSQRGRGLFVTEQATASARTHAQKAVRRTLEAGIRAAHAAGMSVQEVRDLFDAAVDGSAQPGSERR